MTRARVLALVGAAWLASCSAAAAPPANAPPGNAPLAGGPPPSAPPASAPPAKKAKQDPCAARLEEYDAVRAAAPGRCSADADCACYSDIRLDNETHVTDKVSAARLQRLADAYRKRHCPTVCVQTVAQACRPECRAGVCARR